MPGEVEPKDLMKGGELGKKAQQGGAKKSRKTQKREKKRQQQRRQQSRRQQSRRQQSRKNTQRRQQQRRQRGGEFGGIVGSAGAGV